MVSASNNILASIICVTYNHEDYIRQALDSFVMQQCSFRFEIVVHDDASTDKTAEIIKEYKETYPDLLRVILQEKNQYSQGVPILDNLFADPRCGKYIALCEGDDYWIDPSKLQRQVDFLEANSDYSMCFHNGIKYFEQKYPRVELFNDFNSDCDLNIYDAVHRWVVPTASIVGRHELMMVYPEWMARIYSGDYSLILSLLHAGKIRYLNRMMSVYRINTSLGGGSASSRMLKRNIFMLEQKITLLESFNAGTDKVYNQEVQARIEYLNKELKFQRAKERKNILSMLLQPLFWSKLMSKFHHSDNG